MWEREPCGAPLNMHNAATSARRGDGGRAARSEHSSGDIRIWGPPGRTGPRPSADHVTETSKHRTAPKVTTAQCQTEPGFPEDNPAHGGSPGQHVLLQKVKGGGKLVRPPPAPPSAADASGDDMEMKTVQGAPAPARRRGSRERARRSRADAVYDLLPLMNGSARLAHVLMRFS